MDRGRPRRSEWNGDMNIDHRITVHEPAPSERPVLYDARGNPLTWKRRPIGFADPKAPRP